MLSYLSCPTFSDRLRAQTCIPALNRFSEELACVSKSVTKSSYIVTVPWREFPFVFVQFTGERYFL